MTYEEFQAELTKTPELMDSIVEKHEGDFTKYATEKKDMVVTSKTAYTKDREAAIGEGSKKAHEAWEGKIFELTGVKQNDGEKGLAYYDRVKTKLKYQTEQTDDTPEGRADRAALKAVQTELEGLKGQLKQKDEAVFTSKVNSEVTSGIRALKFAVPAHIKDDAQKTAFQRDQVNANMALFNNLYKPEARQDGSTQFKDKAGNVLVDANGEPLSVEAIFAKNHNHLLVPAGKSQGGTGSGEEDPNKEKPNYLGATTEEIRAAIATKGVVKGSDEWAKLYKEAHEAAGYVEKDFVWTKS